MPVTSWCSPRGLPLTMREGDSVALNLPALRVDPQKYSNLVVTGSIDQPPYNPKDSQFRVSVRGPRYEPGTYTLLIPKNYFTPPDGISRKPRPVSTPAYELTYTVRYIDPTVIGQ